MMEDCTACQEKGSTTLIEVFDTSSKSLSIEENLKTGMKKLCSHCVMGKIVPLMITDEKGCSVWQMCKVQHKCKEKEGTFTVISADGQTQEKVSIPSKPFTEYIAHFKRASQLNTQKYPLHDFSPRPLLSTRALPPALPPAFTSISSFDEDDDWSLDRMIPRIGISNHVSPSRQILSAPSSPTTAIVTPSSSGTTNSKRKRTSSEVDSSPKAIPCPWTTEEDQELVALVEKGGSGEQNNSPKWSDIAQAITTQRTGKQCRERYLNHLKPRLRFEDWTAPEDSLLIRLYGTMGTKWAQMAKIMNGRTDNHIKNRFHHIRRKLEKDVSRIVKMRNINQISQLIRMDCLPKIPSIHEKHSDFAMKVCQALPYLAADSVANDQDDSKNSNGFGPMVFVSESGGGKSCSRCHFIIPSYQTGRRRCQRTHWCETCTKIPSYVEGNMLRQCLNLRKWKEKK